MEIKVDNINPKDRYVEMGFINETKLNSLKQNLIGRYLLGKYSYCGYKMKGFKGTIPYMGLPDMKGLEDGTVVYFKFDNFKRDLSVSNSKGNIDLKANVGKEDVFLYFCIYFENQSAEIKFKNC